MALETKPRIAVLIWDLPLRIFHWLLVVAVLAAYSTAKQGGSLIDWHGYFGVLVLALLLFRLIWGVVGTIHARFASFLPTPAQLQAYLAGRWQGHGHNPLGGLAVLAMLATLFVVVGSGLFANDDIAFQGPWANLIDKAASDTLSAWHSLSFDALTVLIIVHLAALGFYRWHKQQNLVLPMLTGKKLLAETDAQISPAPYSSRFIVALLLALALTWVVYQGIPAFFADAQHTTPALTPSPW